MEEPQYTGLKYSVSEELQFYYKYDQNQWIILSTEITYLIYILNRSFCVLQTKSTKGNYIG